VDINVCYQYLFIVFLLVKRDMLSERKIQSEIFYAYHLEVQCKFTWIIIS
jgi:hypothetical protein